MLHKGNSVSMDPVVIGTFQKNNYEGKTQSLAQKHHYKRPCSLQGMSQTQLNLGEN